MTWLRVIQTSCEPSRDQSNVVDVRFYETLIVLGRPLLVRLLPSLAMTSERLGRAMQRVVQGRADRFILESADINRIGAP